MYNFIGKERQYISIKKEIKYASIKMHVNCCIVEKLAFSFFNL